MFLDFIALLGFCSLIIVIVFLLKSKLKKTTPYLIIILLYILITFINHYANNHNLTYLINVSSIIVSGGGYFLGPLFFLYTRALLSQKKIKFKKLSLLFLPFIIHFIFISLPILNNDFIFLKNYNIVLKKNWEYLYILESLFFTSYIIIALKQLNFYQEKIKSYYSTLHSRDLSWAKKLLYCLLAYQAINIGISLFIITYGGVNFEEDYILLFNTVIICLYLGYNGIFQSQIFIPEYFFDKKENSLETSSVKKQKTELSTYNLNIKKQIENSLAEKKLFLNDSLTLRDLATAIAMKEKQLSIFINQQMQTSFYELINEYRISEFKEKIKTDNNLTILGVANSCGFKSKTSFYRIFKKSTGITPSEYLKQLKEKVPLDA